MYENGQGTHQDLVHAHMWYNLAAAAGNEDAAAFRDTMATRMSPIQIDIAQHLAREWKPKSEHTEDGGRHP